VLLYRLYYFPLSLLLCRLCRPVGSRRNPS